MRQKVRHLRWDLLLPYPRIFFESCYNAISGLGYLFSVAAIYL